MNNIAEQLATIEAQAKEGLAGVSNPEDLKVCRAKFLGRKGLVTDLLKQLGTLSSDERPIAGKKINELKMRLEADFSKFESNIQSKNISSKLKESVDITLPGRGIEPGKIHPITQTLNRMLEIFTGLGFSVQEGPEIETDYYNFEALNVPKDHPARDMHDTFYVQQQQHSSTAAQQHGSSDLLLRTHTSPVQIRVMESCEPPIRMVFPGAVYRRDADVSHSPMFHQVEGLLVDKNITMGDLKGILTEFLHQMFGKETKVRFRSSFFPFTEPSAEVDIQCVLCKGKAKLPDGKPCRVCKESGWMEILGSGMVDPNVFEAVGYNPKKVSGFAFGMGVERIAMLKYGINDIRLFFENDMRFLEQF